MEIKELKKKQVNTCTPEQYDERIKKLRKDHDRLVKGKFEFTDAQGGWFEFCYRFFKGDPLVTMKLIHGEITELPLGVVRHLNNTVKKVRNFGFGNAQRGGELPEGRGLPSTFEIQSRVKFIPVDVF